MIEMKSSNPEHDVKTVVQVDSNKNSLTSINDALAQTDSLHNHSFLIDLSIPSESEDAEHRR